MSQAEIIVVTHKKYAMPKSKIYLPLQVGAKNSKLDFGYKKDSTGKNISEKNPAFCELTGLYWLWQNSNADFKGLVHYRRHLTMKAGYIPNKNRLKFALSNTELNLILKNYDLILPKKRHYYIESLWSHYEHTLHIGPLIKTGEIVKEKYPEFYPEFEKLKTRRSAHMFNILIAKSELFDEYASWLFDILFELEQKMGQISEDPFHARFYGRISELLFDVWLYTKYPNLKYKELRVLNIEKIHWLQKGISFILAKFIGKKYDKSF